MKIYFVRHGQTSENVNHIWSGHSSVELTEEGREQVRKSAALIPKTCSIIYSSDLIRCRQTTEILNKELNLPVIFDARFREVDIGQLRGKHTTLETDPEVKKSYYDVKYDFRSIEGESVEDVRKRILSGIEDVKEHHKNEEVVVVTHGGIIGLLHHTFNKDNIPELIHNASIHEFEFK